MATNVTNAAETNLIKAAQMKKVREVDFVEQFGGDVLPKLMEVLGVTRQIPMMEGTTMYVYKTTGTLQSGAVPEGEIIPLSQYERTKTGVGEITLKKWRKAASAEAIKKSGYQEAVTETDAKLLKDVQKGIRTDLFTFLAMVESAYRQPPLIYTYRNFYNKHLVGKLDDYKIMIAMYTPEEPELVDGRDITMWQYTSKGRIVGVSGYVDKSRFMGKHGLRDIRFRHIHPARK